MMLLFSRLVAIIWVLGIVSGQATLPADEVESLGMIAKTLGKTDWNFRVDPCSTGWVSTQNTVDQDYYENTLTCDCTFPNNTCHVVSIILKAQFLSGSVPKELIRLPFLQEIDLTWNNLNGTIPPEWGSMNLVNISLLGNRVSGSIPAQLANISTLTKLNLDYNQLSGTIPPEFGNLSRIEILTLNSNNLTGELPATLERLSTMIDFRISDNNFRGSIPDFIQNWTNIERLEIQGTGLSGPIPSFIASGPYLTDLRISDLGGNDSAIPNLSSIRGLKTLMLRSCNIVGELPKYNNRELIQLKVLDLSFNKLSGPISDWEALIGLQDIDYIYLTGNSLSGPLPEWILNNNGKNYDVSYNNFTPPNPDAYETPNLNLFPSSRGNTSGVIVSCLQPISCEREYYSFHINCGGRQVDDGKGKIYEDDADPGGPSKYFWSGTNWGFSGEGYIVDDDRPSDPSFVYQNESVISGDDPELYTDARLSPLSLFYYGACLRNGNYTVNLHFAEIVLWNDRTYYSFGRRLFDVYIQGKRVLKDFNIPREAGGVNMGIKRNFTAVVTDTTLDIRFYWAGKGTFGPLISAISVDPNYTPPEEKIFRFYGRNDRISTGVVVSIVLGVALMFLLVLGVILWWKGCLGRKDGVHNGIILLGATGTVFLTTIGTVIYFIKSLGFRSADEESNYRVVEIFLRQHGLLAPKRYKYSEIKEMTKSFSDKLGQGGYGSVYKGNLPDGTLVAVKLLSSIDENVEDFINEVASISRTSHVNIVTLLGFCFDRKKRALVYEYMPNKSLDKYISKSESSGTNSCLDLEILYKIAVGVAEGLDYLHRGCNTRIVHFDIKPQNILLDEEFCPKISDFGLAKLCKKKQSLLSVLGTRGTVGYIAPEVFSRNYGGVSHKSDVYSYGMMVLEMVGANMVAILLFSPTLPVLGATSSFSSYVETEPSVEGVTHTHVSKCL